MYNMFLHERRQKLAEDQAFNHVSTKKLEFNNNKYKEHLIKNFEKRLDKFIDFTIANPMEPVNTFLLNESFVKHKTNHGYKTHLGDKNAPSFKTGFYQQKKDLNKSCIEKLETPLIGPIVGKPFEFRKRQVDMEIQPGMRYRNKRISSNYNEKPNTSFSHGGENVEYEPIIHERGVIRYGVESKKSTGRGRFSYSSCSSSVISSENMPQKEIPKKSEITCGGNWLPLKSVLTRAIDAYGPGKLRERSLNNKTMQQNYSFVEEDKGDKSELDDSMLTGIDFLGRSRMIKSAYNPDRAMSVPKARAVLRTANLLK